MTAALLRYAHAWDAQSCNSLVATATMPLMDLNLPALEMQTLFDALPDVVFFIKDSEGRYTHCNLTLVRRLGRKLRSEVIGRSPLEVFPLPLGGSYMMQERLPAEIGRAHV